MTGKFSNIHITYFHWSFNVLTDLAGVCDWTHVELNMKEGQWLLMVKHGSCNAHVISQCWMMSCFLGNWHCAMETWAGKKRGGNKSLFNSHWVIFPLVSPLSLCPVHCPHSVSGYPWEHKQTAQHPSLNLLPQYEKPAAQDTTWNKIDGIIMCVHPSH